MFKIISVKNHDRLSISYKPLLWTVYIADRLLHKDYCFHSNCKENKILLNTFEIEVFTFECTNRPVCYLVGSCSVSLPRYFLTRTHSELQKGMTPAMLVLFSFSFCSFLEVKNSIPKEKVSSSSSSAGSQLSMSPHQQGECPTTSRCPVWFRKSCCGSHGAFAWERLPFIHW